MVQPGDEITVKVLSVDDEKGKISLGLKQLQADPWTTADDTYEVGQVLMGTVTRIADFGAFVELEPGIEALAHVSTFPPTGKRDLDGSPPCSPARRWRSRSSASDLERKRIGVALVREGERADEKAEVREYTKQREKTESAGFGSLADKLRDAMKKDS